MNCPKCNSTNVKSIPELDHCLDCDWIVGHFTEDKVIPIYDCLDCGVTVYSGEKHECRNRFPPAQTPYYWQDL